ncbi:hypothetical protein CR513_29904, partial [Mucuna pruriens]
MARELSDSLGVGKENIGNIRRRQIAELKRVKRGFNYDVVEAEAVDYRSGRGELGFGEVTGEGGVEILDDPNFPVRVAGRDPEDLGRAFVLMADAEGAVLLRVGVGWGLGFEVRGSFGSGGGEYHPAVPYGVFPHFWVPLS